MSNASLANTQSKAPWHLWLVAVLSLLWNLSGAITILMAQTGMLQSMTADEAAYYAAQPLLFVILTDIALFTPLAGAIALMFRSKLAVWLYGISLLCILTTNTWDLLAGTSRVYATTGAVVMIGTIVVLGILQLLYARRQHKRGLLR